MANSWQVGTFYVQPNGYGGNFRQPGGPGTQVFPAQVTSVEYFQVTPFSELSGSMSAGCGHFQDYATLQQEYDADNDELVMLCVCSVCSYIQFSLPLAQALSTVQQPWIVV